MQAYGILVLVVAIQMRVFRGFSEPSSQRNPPDFAVRRITFLDFQKKLNKLFVEGQPWPKSPRRRSYASAGGKRSLRFQL